MATLAEYLQVHPKKQLIFDFDETLFTLDLPWNRYYVEMARRLYELDPTFPKEKRIYKLENGITEKWGLVAARIRWEYSTEFERDNLRGVLELTDLTNFIRQFYTQYTLYLWTSNMRSTVEPILQKNGLLQYFSTLVTKGDVLLMKPNPEGFNLIFDPRIHKKEEFLMIGNSQNDLYAAENASIDFWIRPA